MAMDIKPTRSELMKLKRKIKLAQSGYNLLKKKRDGLIIEFFDMLQNAKSIRKELTEVFSDAKQKLNVARTFESDLKIKSLALGVESDLALSVSSKNMMGVIVPRINSTGGKKGDGYAMSSSTHSIDEAAKGYEALIDKVIIAAETETTMKKLLAEIEKTKRRVNALEFAVIPKMEEAQAHVTMRLEEMERENLFRMKRIKG